MFPLGAQCRLCSAGSVAQHHAGAARAPDTVAHAVGSLARLGAGADLIEWTRAATAQHVAQYHRIVSAQNLSIAVGDPTIVRQRMLAGEPGAELDAPGTAGRERHPLLELGDEWIGRPLAQRHHLPAVAH